MLCLLSALSREVGALEISIIIIRGENARPVLRRTKAVNKKQKGRSLTRQYGIRGRHLGSINHGNYRKFLSSAYLAGDQDRGSNDRGEMTGNIVTDRTTRPLSPPQ